LLPLWPIPAAFSRFLAAYAESSSFWNQVSKAERRTEVQDKEKSKLNGVGTQAPLVMVRIDNGFRVYSPANPAK
jgi:hypothetical protein